MTQTLVSKVDSNQLLTQVMLIQLNSRSNINENNMVKKCTYCAHQLFYCLSAAGSSSGQSMEAPCITLHQWAMPPTVTHDSTWQLQIESIQLWLKQTFWKHGFESAHDSSKNHWLKSRLMTQLRVQHKSGKSHALWYLLPRIPSDVVCLLRSHFHCRQSMWVTPPCCGGVTPRSPIHWCFTITKISFFFYLGIWIK